MGYTTFWCTHSSSKSAVALRTQLMKLLTISCSSPISANFASSESSIWLLWFVFGLLENRSLCIHSNFPSQFQILSRFEHRVLNTLCCFFWFQCVTLYSNRLAQNTHETRFFLHAMNDIKCVRSLCSITQYFGVWQGCYTRIAEISKLPRRAVTIEETLAVHDMYFMRFCSENFPS